MDADHAGTTHPPRHPSSTALAVLLTFTLLGALLLGWIWYTRYAPVHFDLTGTATLTDAENARFIIPIIAAGIFLIALTWLLVWRLARWSMTPLPITIGTLGVIALLIGGVQLWRDMTAHQPITVFTYLCEPDAERMTSRTQGLPAGCEVVPSTETMTIGTADSPTMFRPDADSNSLNHFSELPQGTYDALLHTTARSNTAEVVLAAETGDGIRAVSPLQHAGDGVWISPIALHPNLEHYFLLLYPSPFAESPDARIRLSVQECRGTSLADFDASACTPASLTSPVVENVTAESSPGRPSALAIDTAGMTFTNLEARTYTFEPITRGNSLLRGASGMLVLPAEGPQTSDNSILEVTATSPQGSFTVDVGEGDTDLHYIIYVFADDSPVIARVRP